MVAHLTFEELLEFNSLGYAEARVSELASRVTTHVRTCGECRLALTAIQNTEEKMSAYANKRIITRKSVITESERETKKLF